ncbi:vitamin K epoxide reductase complex subunit 1-like protein 1 [Corticium candelabrum]|uniref:vitamin K epoxide reductase complex subunit 1-like protein 1 n=1 Tax=Corticium candelabrum TaxID=121492 RepID=UPI002E264B3D|nr:vitamin K epoxide reductase complex subunit 1-like protein 1 [Corticium candelabrum]
MGLSFASCRAVLCVAGLCLSAYALYIEIEKHRDASYRPLCDISEGVSCTKAFLSEYGRGFGIIGSLLGKDSMLNQPNAAFGMIFYCIFIFIGLTRSAFLETVGLVLAIGSCIVSVYLSYVLYLLKDVCIVCMATYIMNFLLMLVTIARRNELNGKTDKRE